MLENVVVTTNILGRAYSLLDLVLTLMNYLTVCTLGFDTANLVTF